MEDKIIIGYMDKIDFECEAGDNPNGNIFYPSVEALLKEISSKRMSAYSF